MDPKAHWEEVYRTRPPEQLSWTQEVPKDSLDFIESFHLPADARILDIGGGDSRLVDCLLEAGYRDITVLDISGEALHRAKLRLGNKAEWVKWVVADITEFRPDVVYHLWHDRATFHFLTTASEVNLYLDRARKAVVPGGYAVIGTFSEKGPDRCSGLPIQQYSEETLDGQLRNGFEKIRCVETDHRTPFDTLQRFLFCSFKRRPPRQRSFQV
jgi:SAM-dependent methyltransferase